MKEISIVIPVYNEQERLINVLKKLSAYSEVIIIDDASRIRVDTFVSPLRYKNVKIITNVENIGYLKSIKSAIAQAKYDIIVTMDGDGEHRPEDIEKLIEPIQENKCDVVFGKRPNIARPSEVFLLKVAKFFTKEVIEDSGTGFRAFRSKFAKRIEFNGKCTCGLLLMECHFLNMRICEVEVTLPIVNKVRRIAWEHFMQFFFIIKFYLKYKKEIN